MTKKGCIPCAKISFRVSEDPTERHNEDTTYRLFGQEVLQRAGARTASQHYGLTFPKLLVYPSMHLLLCLF